MKRNYKKLGLVLYIILALVLSSCSTAIDGSSTSNNSDTTNNGNINIPEKLVDQRSVYVNDKDDEVINIFITVLKSFNESGQRVTLDDVNGYGYASTNEKPEVEVIFQEGNETGPTFGSYAYNASDSNGVMAPRGQSTLSAKLKSYKVKLYSKSGPWRNQYNINLNKHPNDNVKVKNKLSFDYFETMPDMVSLRTVFVNVHIKDLSKDNSNSEFEDMGLYTAIENVNGRYLSSHGLQENGNLYKATLFEFFRYEDIIKNSDDPTYDKAAFDNILEIKGSDDHSKLIKMLEDVNNYSLDINDVIDKHFERENYLTWMAANIIMGNIDVSTQNFYLYSPIYNDKWYFIPWDYDGGWYDQDSSANATWAESWTYGIAKYWGTVLHRRFLKDPDNIADLTAKVQELSKLMTKEKTTQMLNSYYPIVKKYISQPPDLLQMEYPLDQFEANYFALADVPQKNVATYMESLEDPLPVYLSNPVISENQINFLWENSYDFQGDDLVYDFQISRTPDFKDIVYEKKDLIVNSISVPKTQPGYYYYRIVIRDSKGNEQLAFDRYVDESRNRYYGVIKFKVQ